MPRLSTVVLAAVGAGAGIGLLASGVPTGPSAIGVVCATALALAGLRASAGNLARARTESQRDLLDAERARLARELHSALGHLAFIQAQATQLRRHVPEHDEPLGDIASAAGDAARETRLAIQPRPTGAAR